MNITQHFNSISVQVSCSGGFYVATKPTCRLLQQLDKGFQVTHLATAPYFILLTIEYVNETARPAPD